MERVHCPSEDLPLPLVLPQPRNATVDEDTGGDPPRLPIYPLVKRRLDEVAPPVVPHEERLEIRQESDNRSRHVRPPQGCEILLKKPLRLSIDAHGGEIPRRAGPDPLRPRDRHAAPRVEVLHRGGTVRTEVPPQELRLRLLHREVPPFREPDVRPHERRLVPLGRSRARDP